MPDWYQGSFQLHGMWLTNPPAWYVPAEQDEGKGQLFILLDRELLTNDLTMEIELFDYEGSSLHVDLADTNFAEVVTDLYGNLMEGSNEVMRIPLTLPLEEHKDAAVIWLWRGYGDVLVYASELKVSESISASKQDTQIQAQGIGRGISPATDASRESGRDKVTGQERAEEVRSEKAKGRGRIIYVDAKQGRSEFDGFHPSNRGNGNGPKKTINGALGIAEDGDTVSVAAGHYKESVKAGKARLVMRGRVVID